MVMKINENGGTHFGEQLIDNSISNAGSTVGTSTLLENGIQLVEDDDMQTALISLFFIL